MNRVEPLNRSVPERHQSAIRTVGEGAAPSIMAGVIYLQKKGDPKAAVKSHRECVNNITPAVFNLVTAMCQIIVLLRQSCSAWRGCSRAT